MTTRFQIPPDRVRLFQRVREELQNQAEFDFLTELYELPPEFEGIIGLDVTKVPGCHYGVDNPFVRIIQRLEEQGIEIGGEYYQVTPDTAIILESSTGNAWIACVDAARKLGYEVEIIMPGGLPPPRYEHPEGIEVPMTITPKEDYVKGIAEEMRVKLLSNSDRLKRGLKPYASPNHSIYGKDLAAASQGTIIDQFEVWAEKNDVTPDEIYISMGNGTSAYGLGKAAKEKFPNIKVCLTESLAFGGGYNMFAEKKGLDSYQQLFGIEPGELMGAFDTIGTNAPIGVKLPLQELAIEIADKYVLFTSQKIIDAYKKTNPTEEQLERVRSLPNRDNVPPILYQQYGNSSIANIMAAVHSSEPGKKSIVTLYDARSNY